MSDALKKKMTRCKGLRTSYSNAVGNAEKVLESSNPSTSKLLGAKSKLISVSEQLSKINEEIFELIEADDVESDVLESESVTCELDEILAELSLSLESVNASHERSNSRSSIGAAINPDTVNLQSNSKLPKLDFSVFKANPVDWTTFWDQFKTSIHLNSRFSDIDKFNYFKKYLDGQAVSAISGLTLSSENYHKAIDLLKNRFRNTQILISAHMETLLNANKVRNFDDTIALRKDLCQKLKNFEC